MGFLTNHFLVGLGKVLPERVKEVFLQTYIRLRYDVVIDKGTRIGKFGLARDVNVRKSPEKDIKFGKHSLLRDNSEIRGGLSVGNFSMISGNTRFQAYQHNYNRPGMRQMFFEMNGDLKKSSSHEKIKIGNDVWIGFNSVIMNGVEVGDGAIVGSGAVVTHDVQPYEVVGGVPAEHIKWRFPEDIRDKLLEIEWWNWPMDKIEENSDFFRLDLTDIDSKKLEKYI